jgi:hypothetical protein
MEKKTSDNKCDGAFLSGSAFIRIAIVIGIAVLVNIFLAYLVRAFYVEPIYTDFCPETPVVKPIIDQDSCLSIGGQWNESRIPESVSTVKGSDYAYCNEQFTCSKNFERENSLYNRNLFGVFIIVSVVLLLGSPFLSGVRTVSSGLSLGGVMGLIFGSVRYWSDMDDWLRVIVSGVSLVSLLIIAWNRFKDE